MSASSAPHTSLADRIRLEWYLLRLESALQDYPGRRRKQILAELRGEVMATARDTGMAAALADLGRPARLAARYLSELPEPRPRWNDGAVLAALVAFGFPVYCWFAYGIGASEALDAVGGGKADISSVFGVDVRVVSTAGGGSISFAPHWGWYVGCLVVGVVAFLLGARAWRALRD
ncbi:HAAS signaling domain-containing protein [Antribacter soli]